MIPYERQTAEIRAICKELLKQDKVDVVLGYSPGGVEGLLVPFFARTPEDADQLTWGNRCYQNLASYLHGRKDRIGIVAKPCDVRAIIQYIIEKQLSREQVYIIGVDCAGMVDAAGKARPGCNDCGIRIPPLCDVHVVDDSISQTEAPGQGRGEELSYNLEKFQQEIDKCILCYSCRQSCFGCYCKTCFIDRGMPDWQPAEVNGGTKMAFHLGRAMHLAGRCVECGSCEAACASGVNIRYIIKELTCFVKDTYGFSAGMDMETTPCMTAYAADDREIGFLGSGDGSE